MASNYRGDEQFNIINKMTYATPRDTKIRDIRRILMSTPFNKGSDIAIILTDVIYQGSMLEYRSSTMLSIALLMYNDVIEKNIELTSDIIDEYYDTYRDFIQTDPSVSDIEHKEAMYRYYRYVLIQSANETDIAPVEEVDLEEY